jgi:histidinol-phosphate aminotransferase
MNVTPPPSTTITNSIRGTIRAMAGYTPGEQNNHPDVVKLNTNENPYPPSPKVFAAVQQALTGDALRKYPQPLGDTFRKAAGRVLGIDPACLMIGNGSDDILTILTRAFVPQGGRMASLTPSYILYKSLAEIQGATLELVPYTQYWTPPTPWPVRDAHLTFIANPNSPSGTLMRPGDIAKFAAEVRGPLVLDEAYADFAETNGLELIGKVPNLIITRTFSKFYALAGIRFGYAIAAPDVIQQLVKVKDSYNADVLALAAATAAIQDQEYYTGVRAKIVATRGRMMVALTELGFHVTPSHANFVWCRREDRPVKPIYEALREKNILVRYMNYAGFGDGLRMTVGTTQEVERLLSELRGIVG